MSAQLDNAFVVFDGPLHYHPDGGISTVGNGKWYVVERGVAREIPAGDPLIPLGPSSQHVDDFIPLGPLNFSTMDLPRAMTHVKFRDITVPRNKGIGGCHDKVEFARIRQVDMTTNPGYSVPAGQTLNNVPEIIVTSKRPHSSVPGVEVVEYKIPAIDGNTNPNVTTGALKGKSSTEAFQKTIYDPVIWTDAKLETALQEALQDAAHNAGGVLSDGKFSGVTSGGYRIEGFIRGGRVDTFYFP